MLRFFGLRASEAALVSLNDLQRIREGRARELDVMQPKTGCFRKVLVPEGLVHVLRVEHSSDLSTLLLSAGKDGSYCLGASVKGETRGCLKGKRDWVTSLNRYLGYASDKVKQFPRITTHCFRVNFITSLLNESAVQCPRFRR
jgi:hypothetical protein